MINLDYKTFLDSWFSHIDAVGIDYSSFKLDHLGYSASSKEDYELVKNEFLRFSTLQKEPLVSGRRVGVFKLNTPWLYKDHSINALELVEPRIGESSITDFEHAKFTVNLPLESLAEKYPHLPWDQESLNRPEFPRLKLVFPDKTEVKFNCEPILAS